MLGLSHWAVVGYILHGLGLGVGGCMLDAQLVQEVVGHDGLPEGHWLVIVLRVDQGLLHCSLHCLLQGSLSVVN